MMFFDTATMKKSAKWIFFVLLSLFLYTLYEPYRIELRHDTIISHKITPDTENLKIVFVSDIHHGPFMSRDRIHELVLKINHEHPDLIFLGGDYVHRGSKYIVPCFEEFGYLKAKYGTFAVLGNHDHWENKKLTVESIKKAHITLLDNNASWINIGKSRIKIGGVGDYTEDVQNLEPTLQGLLDSDFTILLTHNPDYLEEILDNTHIDLVMAGHTHGGQVTFFGKYAPILPTKTGQKYRSGKIQVGTMTLIVSNGIGTVTPPVRFFARPQINIVTLKSH